MIQSHRPARSRWQRDGNACVARRSLALPRSEQATRDKGTAMFSKSSPADGNTCTQPIIRHRLKGGRVHQHRKFGVQFAADLIVRRNNALTDKPGTNAAVLSSAALK